MVLGNGLVAKGFKVYEKNKNVIIFASGVSNSTEKEKKNLRESLLY